MADSFFKRAGSNTAGKGSKPGDTSKSLSSYKITGIAGGIFSDSRVLRGNAAVCYWL